MIYTWQTPAWNRLSAALGQLPHALLLHGPRGVGKLALATRFSQRLLCESAMGSDPCEHCNGCRWFADGNHPDFRLVQPESLAQEAEEDGSESERSGKRAKPSTEIRVSQIRELGEFLYVGSHRGARRVALIHPAEAMNSNAANALLKALEEPPASAVFVLVSHHPARLLATVKSRCVRLGLTFPDRELALDWMESTGVSDAARWLAFAGGAPLLAAEYAGRPDAEQLAQMLDAMATGQFPAFAVNTRESLEFFAEIMQKHAYDLAFVSLTGKSLYRTTGGVSPKDGSAWVRFAREMGRDRLLASRPLNPALFAAELTARFSELRTLNV